ncbi:kinase-like protein [Poronia punctata]|nr:kinase-like protein [Poronia punctata]
MADTSPAPPVMESAMLTRKASLRSGMRRRASSPRAGSAQPSQRPNSPVRSQQSQASGEASPVRKRVVRLSAINTPSQQPGRVVRIAAGSSGNRSRTSISTSSSRRTDSLLGNSEKEGSEEPNAGSRSQPELDAHNDSRLGSNGSRNRIEHNSAPQSSMRLKRLGKAPGSFLSGPARRGRRRQSEEDAAEDGGELQRVQDSDEHATPGKEKDEAIKSREATPDRGPDLEPDEIIIPHYRVPPPMLDLPARHDQENEAPPTFKRERHGKGILADKDYKDFEIPPIRPISISANAQRPASPDRKALGSLSQNTPRRPVPPPPPKMSILDAATANAGAATTSQGARRRNYMKVNGKCYTRIDCLGRGGSGKVYRVAADNGKMFALKRVSIENADESTVKGYKGEIDLLKKLTSVERVITLYDYEMNEEKQVLSLLMEMGELDLNTLLRNRFSAENAKFDPVFVRYYWQEMLECVAAVHAYDIVHSDLKPANFVMVQGRLKLIDFGIANAIQIEETVNVHRETQIGTPSYMSPESLLDSNAAAAGGRRLSTNPTRPKLMKLGKPSDIWSLGCILYQMVYGSPPFAHIPNPIGRCQAIINWNYDIEFRERGIGDVPVPPSLMRTMKRCLNRDQHLRPTCEELLSPADPFLYPVESPEGSLPISEELLGRIIQSVVARCRERIPTEAEVLSVWPGAYWGSVSKALGQEVKSGEGR